MMANPLLVDSTWLHQTKFEEAEAFYQRALAGTSSGGGASGQTSQQKTPNKQSSNKQQGSTLKSEIAQARQNIQKALNEPGSTASPAAGAGDAKLMQRVKTLEDENNNLKKASQDLTSLVKKLEARVAALELSNKSSTSPATATSAPAPAAADSDSDSSGLFGSDSDESEDEETKAKLEAYRARKANKPKVIAKSSLLLDVKPWDDETDMKELESCVRSIVMDGLLWGASKFVPVGYGIRKLQIAAVIEDDKVSTDDLEDKITAFEDFIQSMDIAAFNKI